MSRIDPNDVLAGQVAVVTGASRRSGQPIALRYAIDPHELPGASMRPA